MVLFFLTVCFVKVSSWFKGKEEESENHGSAHPRSVKGVYMYGGVGKLYYIIITIIMNLNKQLSILLLLLFGKKQQPLQCVFCVSRLWQDIFDGFIL